MLNDVYTTTEASKLWNLEESTVKKACQKGLFKNNEYRKSENTWLVSKYAMYERYGSLPGTNPSVQLSFSYEQFDEKEFIAFDKFIGKMQLNAHANRTSFTSIKSASIDVINKSIIVEIEYRAGFSEANVRRMFKAGVNKVLGRNKLA